MPIRHLVISGGGPILIQILSSIRTLETAQHLCLDHLQSIYATSAGTIVGVLLGLRFDWDTLMEFIVRRPWHDVFAVDTPTLMSSYADKGLFDRKTLEKCFRPLFGAKDLSLQITLKEFYEWSRLDIHLFTFDINTFQLHQLSHSTHPDLPLLQAIQMTSALPVLIQPVFINGGCYIDGGVACNYPLSFCLADGHDPSEILGIKNDYGENSSQVEESATLMDYLFHFIFQSIFHLQVDYAQPTIENEMICHAEPLTIEFIHRSLHSVEFREELIERGKRDAEQYLTKAGVENESSKPTEVSDTAKDDPHPSISLPSPKTE